MTRDLSAVAAAQGERPPLSEELLRRDHVLCVVDQFSMMWQSGDARLDNLTAWHDLSP